MKKDPNQRYKSTLRLSEIMEEASEAIKEERYRNVIFEMMQSELGFNLLRYHYKATVQQIYDGDTITHMIVDQGFRNTTTVSIRLKGVDTEEIRGGTPKTKAEAKRVLEVVKSLILGKEVYIKTEQDRNFNQARTFRRYVADIYFNHPSLGFMSMSKYLIEYEGAEIYEE
jgi:endonuclease YncB( thermonuclease family)